MKPEIPVSRRHTLLTMFHSINITGYQNWGLWVGQRSLPGTPLVYNTFLKKDNADLASNQLLHLTTVLYRFPS